VGERGRVTAIDLQPELLRVVEARAARAGLSRRVRALLCTADDIGFRGRVDFVNAFWMVHETPDAGRFLRQVSACLGDGGHLLVAEPAFHVSRRAFAETVRTAEGLGLRAVRRPRIWFSRAVVLQKGVDAPDGSEAATA
jgi:cyclopropane fatty-acyl-phospholipid synthase-like methyltransferase